jgi:methylenetetrahydrofolate dehydrogenase (NADP+)/methenyltetrahydrofolate cyclohydrolase
MIDASYVKTGACVIDVGVTPVNGKVYGDVDRESVEPVAGWLTPVPGGVGPMTIAMLMRNTVALATAQPDFARA